MSSNKKAEVDNDSSEHPQNGGLTEHRKRAASSTKPSPPPSKRPRTSPPSDIGTSSGASKPQPYLETINRSALDFDLPPICSVNLVSHSVYVCLTCGRYFHGRVISTPAHTHSLHERHNLFMNLATARVYCLPEDYAVAHPSLSDIVSAVNPKFHPSDIADLDKTLLRLKLSGRDLRIRGAVGLDSMHGSNAANVILQLLLRPNVIRDTLLLHQSSHQNSSQSSTHVTLHDTLALVCRKIWASHAFRPHVAPHAFMQYFSRAATKFPALLSKPDPVNILSWALNTLSSRTRSQTTAPSNLSGDRKFSKLIKRCFQGLMHISTVTEPGAAAGGDNKAGEAQQVPAKTEEIKFWFLSLDLPPKPLFKHLSERVIVPQVSLERLLEKYNGESRMHVVETGDSKTHQVVRLPPWLFLVVKRFTKSKFGVEKNPCVVHLPTDALDVSRIWKSVHGRYRLIGTVSHDGSLEKGQFHVSVFHEAAGAWYDVTDVSVKQTVLQLISLRDSYILLYELIGGRNDSTMSE